MEPACFADGTMGGGGCPPILLPRCPECAYVRSAFAWSSVLPSGHYTPQLDRALALPSPETPSFHSWYHRPCRLHFPHAPFPPSPLRAGFGSRQPVTPLSNPSCTLDISPAPDVSPCRSSLPSSSDGYRLSLPLPRMPGMGGIPSPRFS